MNTTIETIGLRVLSTEPAHEAVKVNVNSGFRIEFNGDVNPSTLVKNMVVLEDHNHIYKNINSLKDYSQYSVVKGSISYHDRILTFTPEKPWHTDTCYVVLLNGGITDITGNTMAKKHVSCFYTESVASFPRCEITSPKFGSIVHEMPEYVWKNQFSESYTFQVSKTNTFELLLYDRVIPGNKVEREMRHRIDMVPEEGMYHVRVKSENGEWSDVHQFFLKQITDAVVASEDIPEIMKLEEFLEDLEEPIEILEYFPEKDATNVSLKTNIIYIKMKGKIERHRINFEDCYVYGESFDDENDEYTHGTMEGTWTMVYDSYYDVTYLIFTPKIVGEYEDTEYIETLRSNSLIEARKEEGGETAT